MMSLVLDMTDFNTVVAAAFCVITSAAFWLTVRNAYRQKRWRRRSADLATTGILGVYWFGILVARVAFGYVGPSLTVTLIGTFIFIVVGVHFLGIAIAQRDQFK